MYCPLSVVSRDILFDILIVALFCKKQNRLEKQFGVQPYVELLYILRKKYLSWVIKHIGGQR